MTRPTRHLPRRHALRAIAGVLCVGSGLAAKAEAAFPSHPLRMVVPLPPGGATDAMARVIGEALRSTWRQTVIVDNRAGGGTVIGTQAIARAAPDGYTFGIVISAHTINPSLRHDLPYDTLRDFTPLTRLGFSVMALVANPAFPARDVGGLIAIAKASPGSVSYASLGIGTATHLAGEMLKVKAGIEMTHIPYPGSAPAYNDLLSGNVPVGFVLLDSALPHIRSGKLKLLGLTDAHRSPIYPEFPTIGETVPGYALESSIGFVAPRGLAPEVARKLSEGLIDVLTEAAMRKRLAGLGIEVVASSSADYAAFIRSDIDRWAEVVKASGAKID